MKKQFIVLLVCLISLQLYSNEETNKESNLRIALLNLKAIEVEETLVRAVEENLITEIIRIGKFTVVERSQIDKVMSELKLSNSSEFNEDTAVEIGNLLGVNLVLIGSITKIGNNISINIRGIDVQSGLAKFSASERTQKADELMDKIEVLAYKLSGTDQKTKNLTIAKPELPKFELTPIRGAGIGLTSGGALLLIGGASMLGIGLGYTGPQLDLVIANPAAYTKAEYETQYNTYLALFASGVASLSLGLILVAVGVPLIIMNPINKSVSLILEFDTSLRAGLLYRF